MTRRKYRVLFVSTHAVQYLSPLLKLMTVHPDLEIEAAYCSLQGAEPELDADFGVVVAWDIPLLEGYRWVHIPNRSWRPGLGRFWGLFNPGLWDEIRKGRFDAVVLFTGYRYASFWIALAAAKLSGTAALFGTDASDLRARDGSEWKAAVKRVLWPGIFRLADSIIVYSTPGMKMMRSLGLPPERIVMTPYVVDNDWWSKRAAEAVRSDVRRSWGIPEDAPAVLFCAKLQAWKRPLDLLRAFAMADVPGSYLIFAGEGPLRGQIEAEAQSLGVRERIRMLGFANQSQLPEIYRASDLMVLPSEYEPFGVVVNEAMLCGCPVAVSDRVGAGTDLILPGQNGFIFPFGDVERLAGILKEVLAVPGRLRELGEAAQLRMQTWAPVDYVSAMAQAVALACRVKHKFGQEIV